jgi:hypothetical protein
MGVNMETINQEEKTKCIELICLLQRHFKQSKIKSPNQLLIESKYQEYYDQITQEEIENVIINNQSIIEDWLYFTEDIRWTPAWGLEKSEDKYYCLYLINEVGGKRFTINILSGITACALMIRFTMEDIRLSIIMEDLENEIKKENP